MTPPVDALHDAERYRLFGSIGSPYALKLRAIMRYLRLPFDWVPASLDWVPEGLNRPPLAEAARQQIVDIRPPVIPVVFFPNDRSFRNDSTIVAMALNRESAARSIVPSDPALAFLSHLLEDMADEWGVKIAFHYRWGHEQDRTFKSRIVTGELLGGGFDHATQLSAAGHFAARQTSRMPLVGCTPQNAPLIEETFLRVIAATDRISEYSTFMFGSQPVLADFGWYGQLISLAGDPTPCRIMQDLAPGTFPYLQLLDDASGIDSASSAALELPPKPAMALLKLAGEVYLPFLKANADAFEAKQKSFSFSALGMRYTQETFKYQVKCLRWLQEEFEALRGESRDRAVLILRESGCLEALDNSGSL